MPTINIIDNTDDEPGKSSKLTQVKDPKKLEEVLTPMDGAVPTKNKGKKSKVMRSFSEVPEARGTIDDSDDIKNEQDEIIKEK